MLKKKSIAICLGVLAFFAVKAQDNDQKPPSPEEMAVEEATRLENLLKLEDWQVFYVDSILCHDYDAMMKEMDALQKARVENPDLFYAVNDKWMEKIQDAYHKIFTESQWETYMKSGGERMIKERERRKAKADGALEPRKDKKSKKQR